MGNANNPAEIKNADQFDIYRWKDEEFLKMLKLKPYLVLPFNSGPKNCIGVQKYIFIYFCLFN